MCTFSCKFFVCNNLAKTCLHPSLTRMVKFATPNYPAKGAGGPREGITTPALLAGTTSRENSLMVGVLC
jgi:hypothetical protein